MMSNYGRRRTVTKIEAMGGTSLIQQEQDQHECEESLETQDNNRRRFEKARIQAQMTDSQCGGMIFFNVITCNPVGNMQFDTFTYDQQLRDSDPILQSKLASEGS